MVIRNNVNANVLCGLVLVAGCGLSGDDAKRIEVAQANDLGVTQLETELFEDNGDKIFELRGLDAGGIEVAHVRLRSGVIADMDAYAPGPDKVGSELLFSAEGNDARVVTRELNFFRLSGFDDPAIQRFVTVPEVSAALEREAKIVVAAQPVEQADEVPTYTVNCPPEVMNVTPYALQCCRTHYVVPAYRVAHTMFIRPADTTMVQRTMNYTQYGLGSPCKAYDGLSSCSGAACYYGPNGSARASFVSYPGRYPKVVSQTTQGYTFCGTNWYTTPQTPVFSNTTGTYPLNQGCPGGGTGAGQWDYRDLARSELTVGRGPTVSRDRTAA